MSGVSAAGGLWERDFSKELKDAKLIKAFHAIKKAGAKGISRRDLIVDVFQRHIRADEPERCLRILEEGAYVASVLPHVYLEMSITMPWGTLAIDQKLEVLLGAAPPAKILYGSDESTEPEVIWLSAQLGREALGRVLGTAVERTWLSEAEAHRIGEDVLAGNVRRLHGLG